MPPASTPASRNATHTSRAQIFRRRKVPYPAFKSKQVTQSNGKVLVKGDLTMHGVTREVTLTLDSIPAAVKDPWGNQRIGTQATTTVNRKDWGLTWNQNLDGGGVVVGDQVIITLDIEGVLRKAAKATD